MSSNNRSRLVGGTVPSPTTLSAAGALRRALRRRSKPCAARALLGFHRARDRAGPARDRQARVCGAPQACFRMEHPSACRTTIRCRRRSSSVRRYAISSSFWPSRLRKEGARESDRREQVDGVIRYQTRDVEARDINSDSSATAALEVAGLRTRLLLASEPHEDFACVPAAHVQECRADKLVVLDDRFIPTVMNAHQATRLATFLTELQGLLHQRGEALGRARRCVGTQPVRRRSPIS